MGRGHTKHMTTIPCHYASALLMLLCIDYDTVNHFHPVLFIGFFLLPVFVLHLVIYCSYLPSSRLCDQVGLFVYLCVSRITRNVLCRFGRNCVRHCFTFEIDADDSGSRSQ